MEVVSKVVASVIGFVVIMAIVAVLTAWPTELLWNWLMPDLFGLKTIDFWQALGLCVLGSLIFGSHNSSK